MSMLQYYKALRVKFVWRASDYNCINPLWTQRLVLILDGFGISSLLPSIEEHLHQVFSQNDYCVPNNMLFLYWHLTLMYIMQTAYQLRRCTNPNDIWLNTWLSTMSPSYPRLCQSYRQPQHSRSLSCWSDGMRRNAWTCILFSPTTDVPCHKTYYRYRQTWSTPQWEWNCICRRVQRTWGNIPPCPLSVVVLEEEEVGC